MKKTKPGVLYSYKFYVYTVGFDSNKTAKATKFVISKILLENIIFISY